MVKEKRVYTIPPEIAFVDALADGLWQEVRGDVFKLATYHVLLPTRRACLHLREAFLNRMDAKAALLPHMQPLGDMDEEELYFAEGMYPDIPPAVTPLRRQLLLTQLICQKDKGLSLDQAAQLAKALGQFLDQVQIMRCDTERLGELVTEQDLAKHWQETVAFLEILTKEWPKILAAEGCIDPAERRNRVLEAQAAAWRETPPAFPVIAAGSTGSVPTTADLLGVIALLPQGAVILPGLDQDLDEEAWQSIDEQHPQYGMQRLLKKFEMDRRDVKIWTASPYKTSPKVRLLQEALRPAEVAGAWENLRETKITATDLKNFSRIELDHPQEEAHVIALLMRETLETPEKTASLITPDRDLAARVAAILTRWGIIVNDSAGTSLKQTPVGSFLLDVLAAASPQGGPVDFLTLLKHPYAACGLAPVECRARARQVEIDIWRRIKSEKSDWLDQLRHHLEPLKATWHKRLPLRVRMSAHIQLAETLAQSDEEEGKARLWMKEDGEAASLWLDDWRTAADGFPSLTGDEYRSLCAELMQAIAVRPSYGQHPRLSILGLLEARLLQANLTILSGLNEGVWPPEGAVDPWMSRPMRKDFGLLSTEHRIGLTAHDFVQLASAPQVVLTRSRRTGNAPAIPSRFLLQLETALRAIGLMTKEKDALQADAPWQEWAQKLDAPAGAPSPCAAPEPKPPKTARPSELSVTEIGTWQRNPYAIYAKHILKLKKLDPLEVDIGASERGHMIHDTLDSFIKKYPVDLPEQALDELIAIGQSIFAAYDAYPEVKAFWWPRFEITARWFITHERTRRMAGIRLLKTEAKGRLLLGNFRLKGRADRIDLKPDGTLAISDYKTGAVPRDEDVTEGFEPQLPLLALIAQEGGFEELDARIVSELAYWKLSGRIIKEPRPIKGDVAKLSSEAKAGLERLIEKFADPATPYQAIPKPHLRPRYDDYAHLARLAEWGRTLEEP